MVPALVIVWSEAEPWRVGEAALFRHDDELVLGRGNDGGRRRVSFLRQRPGSNDDRGGLVATGISREQLVVCRLPDERSLNVVRRGQPRLRVNGVSCEDGVVRPGDTVEIERQLLLYCVARPTTIARLRDAEISMDFGEPDADGIIGESPAAWALRDALVNKGRTAGHVLITGESGTGKELAARAIRAHSDRAHGPFVATNASTFSPGLIDAELFGHAKNFPNPGMPERSGLVGDAHGGTLFLDEIGELPLDLHSRLLRVLDADGEYRRVGETFSRRTEFRLVAATNRDPSALKHDLLARIPWRVHLPSLRERREDVPLLARALVLGMARKSPATIARYVRTVGGRSDPRISVGLMDALVRWRFQTNVREIELQLAASISESQTDDLVPPSHVRAMFDRSRVSVPPPEDAAAAELRAALENQGGNVAAAARTLEMSRQSLYRLMEKHGIKFEKSE